MRRMTERIVDGAERRTTSVANPTPKSPAVDTAIAAIAGVDRRASILHDMCVFGHDADSFRDALSAREYTISGMCQQCQDEVFG